MNLNIESIVARFGAQAKEKLTNLGASGEPEDQLRAPFERLLTDLAELCSMPKASVVAVGESALKELKTRPDYAVTVKGLLVGFVDSRHLERELTRAGSRTRTTRRSGKSCARFPTLSTRTATPLASGEMASCRAQSCG